MVDTVSIAPAAGLPDIAFGAAADALAPLVSDALGVLAALGGSQWGIYLGGAPVVVADTVLDLGYTKTYTVSDYPIEGGSFASYDKVETPFEGRVRFAAGGSADVRQALIESVESVVGDLNLYDIVTPDVVYVNANVVREEYRRTQSDGGASLLTIDVSVQEIRILSGDSTTNNASNPASADQTNGGTVQGQTPTTSQSVQSGTASETVASNAATSVQSYTPVTTPLPATLGGGGIGSA